MPGGDAAGSDFGSAVRKFEFWIEFPDFFTGLGIDGEDVVVWRCEEEFSIDEDGRGFESGFFVEVVGIVGKSAGVEGPGDFELGDVGFIDLSSGRKAGAAGIAAVVGPAGGLGAGPRLREQYAKRERKDDGADAIPK